MGTRGLFEDRVQRFDKHRLGANLDFGKHFEKYARLAWEQKFPEIYHAWLTREQKLPEIYLITRDRILLFVSALPYSIDYQATDSTVLFSLAKLAAAACRVARYSMSSSLIAFEG